MKIEGIADPVTTAPLPELLRFADGRPVATPADWAERREEVAQAILGLEYGPLPPVPEKMTFDVVSESSPRVGVVPGTRYRKLLVTLREGPRALSFHLDLFLPPGEGPFPVVLYGDGCWLYVTDAIRTEILGRGRALAIFDRCELARDEPGRHDCGLWDLYPGGEYATLAVWAWGYHRAIDVLEKVEEIDGSRIAVTGHSRGGKTVLLAGATDGRIAAVGANNSGCGGNGCFRILGEGCETLEMITDRFPHWFNPAMRAYIGRETELPFDQHFLKALIAPRARWEGIAEEDLWSNPPGSLATFEAAAAVYRLLGAEKRQRLDLRAGNHAHTEVSFRQFLDFLDEVL